LIESLFIKEGFREIFTFLIFLTQFLEGQLNKNIKTREGVRQFFLINCPSIIE